MSPNSEEQQARNDEGVAESHIMAEAGKVQLVAIGTTADSLPARWRIIAESPLSQDRCAAALRLWNPEMLDLMPRLAKVLRTKLVDVRVGRNWDDGWVLLYCLRSSDTPLAVWVGWDPAAFGDSEPPFWDTVPTPFQVFLREVHAGFIGGGELNPRPWITTFAQAIEEPEGQLWGWEDDRQMDTRRLLVIAENGGGSINYCLSPDLRPGEVAWVTSDGALDVRDFWSELDELMAEEMEEIDHR